MTKTRWTPDLIIECIRERQAADLPLNASAVIADDERLYGAARRHYGGWSRALQMAGIDPASVAPPRVQLPRGTWTRDLIVTEIKRYAEEGQDLAAHRMQQADSRLVAAAAHHFGSWRTAIGAAGYDYEKICLTRQWPPEHIVERLQGLDQDGADLSRRTAEAWDPSFVTAATGVFGSWQSALEAAGVEEQRRTVNWARDAILDALQDPVMRAEGGQTGLRKAAIREFGSWPEALREAGVEEEVPAEVVCTARAVREAKTLTLEEVGERMGCSHRWVSMIELGQVMGLRISWALRMAQALGVSVEELFVRAEFVSSLRGCGVVSEAEEVVG